MAVDDGEGLYLREIICGIQEVDSPMRAMVASPRSLARTTLTGREATYSRGAPGRPDLYPEYDRCLSEFHRLLSIAFDIISHTYGSTCPPLLFSSVYFKT